MGIDKLQKFLEKLPDGLEVVWDQSVEGMFFTVELVNEFYYKDMCYALEDLLALDSLVLILEEVDSDRDKVFLIETIWEIRSELEEILREIPDEDLILSFGTNVLIRCTNTDLLIEERLDE